MYSRGIISFKLKNVVYARRCHFQGAEIAALGQFSLLSHKVLSRALLVPPRTSHSSVGALSVSQIDSLTNPKNSRP